VVDGNDVLAVYEAVNEAVARARQGKGPSLLECKTYRWRGHFEGDPTVYRAESELKEWMAKDPIPRFTKTLVDSKQAAQAELDAIIAGVKKDVEAAVAFAQSSSYPEPSVLLDDVYA
jgi:pyruvate dehydrogenase E1 component alpha subunit